MAKKILIISGSPKKNGNTQALINWFAEGAKNKGAQIDIVHAAVLKLKAAGCTSCRKCQAIKEYRCVIDDDASKVIQQIVTANVIVFATPLYFYGPTAQLKVIIDRLFALYKWDNETDAFETALKGKTLVLLGSAYEDVGLAELEKPFKLTADYTGIRFESLLVPNAGVSGEITKLPGIRERAIALGSKTAEN